MKKLLVMLLALTMVLSMALTFAACGDDETDDSSVADSSSKADDSSVAEPSEESGTSADASSEDASSEDASSAEVSDNDSSEDASSEDAASEDSSSDSEVADSSSAADSSATTDVVEYVTTPTKTNYALHKTYTVTKNGIDVTDENYVGQPSSDFADFELTKITDGVTASGEDFNELGGAPGISVSYAGTNAMYEFIIDLGEHYGDINSIVFRGVRDGYQWENNRGFNTDLMMAYVGDSIGTWSSRIATDFSSTPIPGAPEISTQGDKEVKNVENFDYTFTFKETQKGRYVRVIATSPVYVLQFDEIEVWN